MSKECEIVQDLLFGYKDKTLHTASKELVERHLEKCSICKKILKDLEEEENDKENQEKIEEEKEIDYLKNVNKKISKKNKLIIIIGIILLIIILLNIGIFIYYYKEARKVQIYLEDDVTQEQLDNIESSILNIDNNAKIKYYSKEDALNDIKLKFKENANLLSGYETENNPLPAYYIVETSIDNAKNLVSNMENIDGVKKVTGNFNLNPYLLVISNIMVNTKN